MNTALINDIYTDSGFKYTGATTINATALSYIRTIDTDASAYSNLLFPTGEGLRDTTYEKVMMLRYQKELVVMTP